MAQTGTRTLPGRTRGTRVSWRKSARSNPGWVWCKHAWDYFEDVDPTQLGEGFTQFVLAHVSDYHNAHPRCA